MSAAVRDLKRYARTIGAMVTITRDDFDRNYARVRVELSDGLAIEALRTTSDEAAAVVEKSMRAVLEITTEAATER